MSIPAARCLGLFVTGGGWSVNSCSQVSPGGGSRCALWWEAGSNCPRSINPHFSEKFAFFWKRLETTQNSIKRFMLCKHYTYFKHWSNIYLTYHSPSFMPWLGYRWYASQGDHWITTTMYNDHNSQPSWLTPQHTLVFHFQDCFAIGIYNPVISPRVWHVFSRPFPWMWRWSCHSCKRKWLAYHR